MECLSTIDEKELLESLKNVVRTILFENVCTFDGLKSKIIEKMPSINRYRNLDDAIEFALFAAQTKTIDVRPTFKVGKISFDIKIKAEGLIDRIFDRYIVKHYEEQIIIQVDYKSYYCLKESDIFIILAENAEPLRAHTSQSFPGKEILKLKLAGELSCSEPIYFISSECIYQRIYKSGSSGCISSDKYIENIKNVENLKIVCESISLPINKCW